MSKFKYYKFGVYGNIPITEDSQLLERILASDYGLPMVSVGDVVGSETLTPSGQEVQTVVNEVNANLQILSSGVGGYISVAEMQEIFQTGLNKVFTNCKLSFKSAASVHDPVQPVAGFSLWVSSQQRTFAVVGDNVTPLFKYDVFNSDFKTPPARAYLGSLNVATDSNNKLTFTIETGFIITDSVNKRSYWIYIIDNFVYNKETRLFETGSFRCEPQQLEYQLVSAIIADVPQATPEDPFGDDPSSEDSGGDGDNDESSDTVEEPGIPGLDVTDTSFVSIYNPSTQELKNLFNYIWAGSWFDFTENAMDNIAKSFKFSIVNPMSALLGLLLIPVKPQTGQSRAVKLGWLDTGIHMRQVTNQFLKLNCGSVFIPNFYNTFLDYSPYTKYTLYIPFIGSQTLDADMITGKSLQLSYTFDVMTGGCVAFVKVDQSVIAQYAGSCAMQLPLSSSNYSEIANTIIRQPSDIVKMAGSFRSPGAQGEAISYAASSAVNTLKQDITVSGHIKGDAGYIAVRQPYLTITRPNLVYTPPGKRQQLMGYPSGKYVKLSELKGFTKVLDVNMSQAGIPSESSVNEITQLLKEGVVL